MTGTVSLVDSASYHRELYRTRTQRSPLANHWANHGLTWLTTGGATGYFGTMRLGALASVDRWNQVRVDPYEGPAQRGATADNTIRWASGTDARRARAFAERATFVVGGFGAG